MSVPGEARRSSFWILRPTQLLRRLRLASALGGLSCRPDDKLLFTANGPSNDVSIVDAAIGRDYPKGQGRRPPLGRGCGAEKLINRTTSELLRLHYSCVAASV